VYNSVTYDLFTGYIESWTPDFILKPILGPIMILECSDAQKNLSRYKLNNAGYAAELSGARVGHVLDSLGWPAADRSIDTGQSTMQATGALVNIGAMDHLYSLQASDRAVLHCGNGYATFKDRLDRPTNHATSLATFGDNPGAASYLYRNGVLPGGHSPTNDVRLTRTGGTEQLLLTPIASQTTVFLRFNKVTC
jgi:hypothetical protein